MITVALGKTYKLLICLNGGTNTFKLNKILIQNVIHQNMRLKEDKRRVVQEIETIGNTKLKDKI